MVIAAPEIGWNRSTLCFHKTTDRATNNAYMPKLLFVVAQDEEEHASGDDESSPQIYHAFLSCTRNTPGGLEHSLPVPGRFADSTVRNRIIPPLRDLSSNL
jgi:hypothetical protein